MIKRILDTELNRIKDLRFGYNSNTDIKLAFGHILDSITAVIDTESRYNVSM